MIGLRADTIHTYTGEYRPIPDTGIGLTLVWAVMLQMTYDTPKPGSMLPLPSTS